MPPSLQVAIWGGPGVARLRFMHGRVQLGYCSCMERSRVTVRARDSSSGFGSDFSSGERGLSLYISAAQQKRTVPVSVEQLRRFWFFKKGSDCSDPGLGPGQPRHCEIVFEGWAGLRFLRPAVGLGAWQRVWHNFERKQMTRFEKARLWQIFLYPMHRSLDK